MKSLIVLIPLVMAFASGAMPVISVESVTQSATRAVTVSYTLADEPAVVTLDSVMTNGAPMAVTDLLVVSGGANRLMPTGSHTLVWQPPVESGFGSFDAETATVTLKAWPTNAPPDYLVIDLIQKERGARYYTCANAIPGGITDVRYKTDYLVLRRIPAAGVKWRMGSPSTEVGSEAYRASERTHLVELTEDYYCGVYPTTYRQTYWLNGKSFLTQGAVNDNVPPFHVLNWGWDWPQSDIQYCAYRNWFHEKNCPYLAGLADKYADDAVYRFWPKDGHEIDAANTPKCTSCMNGKYTPTLTTFRTNYGFAFDFLTDAQWEFACRGGAANGGHAVCDGSDLADATHDENLSKYGWSADETYGTLVTTTNTIVCRLPQAVGCKLPNGYGLYDMHGLVWELVLDCWNWQGSSNSDSVMIDPVGAAYANTREIQRIQRGGAFCTAARHLRCARRESFATSFLVNNRSESAEVKDEFGMYARSRGYRFWLPCHAVR